ncbi:MAG: phosphoenolpyruvate carboxykinase (ATP) [Clostridia bacterium]|nr:phosphoenolpyruvate carboxykinase (ATP) [Clostridia bacterium]
MGICRSVQIINKGEYEMDLEYLGIINPKAVYRNLTVPELYEHALERKEGVVMDNGALLVKTGKYTGRSAQDKFIVDSEGVHDLIAWGKVNVPVKREKFDAIKAKMVAYLQGRDVFVFDGFAGADKKYAKKFRVICELASEALFIRDLLVRPTEEELETFGEPDYTLIACPGFKCSPAIDGTRSEAAIMIDYEAHTILVAGSQYAGEIKKSVFSTMNFVLPLEGTLPMHCSANMDPETKETAVFFGLSGTGKTTLSADPNRMLIGDDEHGWDDEGIFNIEGGCYAKCIDLVEEEQPEIYRAIRFGSLVENVVVDDKRHPDYSDPSLAINSRVGYPVEYIPNAAIPGIGGIPKVVIFLTCDSFGVLPPISLLSKEAAMYQFVTGFTSKVAGTEIGINEPVPTFSTLFGEPFMPLRASVYAGMLGERIEKYNTKVYLVNTGWVSGPAVNPDGTKNPRMKLRYTRAMITAALNDAYAKQNVPFTHDDLFNLDVPAFVPGADVPAEIMNPRNLWADKDAYDAQAKKLAGMFQKNFESKYPDMPEAIKNAGPKA